MLSFLNAEIWLYKQAVDFRKQLDGLMVIVSSKLKKDPTSGQWFVFRNKGGDKIKILLWEKNGFWMLYKRVEKGRFQFPEMIDEDSEISPNQLSWLLSGLGLNEKASIKPVAASHFY